MSDEVGARHFLVIMMPDLSNTPQADAYNRLVNAANQMYALGLPQNFVIGVMSQLADGFNMSLSHILQSGKLPGKPEVRMVDINPLFKQVQGRENGVVIAFRDAVSHNNPDPTGATPWLSWADYCGCNINDLGDDYAYDPATCYTAQQNPACDGQYPHGAGGKSATSHYLFFNGEHPTECGHRYMGAYIAAQMVGAAFDPNDNLCMDSS